jgi:hypothetical protein
MSPKLWYGPFARNPLQEVRERKSLRIAADISAYIAWSFALPLAEYMVTCSDSFFTNCGDTMPKVIFAVPAALQGSGAVKANTGFTTGAGALFVAG